MVSIMEKITSPMPSKRALAALDQPAPADVGPPKRISKKVRSAIDAMVSGDCKKICDAAAKVGLARESLSRALSTPHVAEHLRQKVLRHWSSTPHAPAPPRPNCSTAPPRSSATAPRASSWALLASRPPPRRAFRSISTYAPDILSISHQSPAKSSIIPDRGLFLTISWYVVMRNVGAGLHQSDPSCRESRSRAGGAL